MNDSTALTSSFVREQQRYTLSQLSNILDCSLDETVHIVRKLKEFGILKTVSSSDSQKELSELDELMYKLPEDHPALINYNKVRRGATDTVRSIIISANSRLAYMQNEKVLRIMPEITSGLTGQITPAIGDVLRRWGWLIALGGLGQTGIYFFYYRNLKHFEVWLVKLYLLLMPVLSCFIGVFFLGEELTAKKLLGILVVLSGAAVILLRSRIHHEGKTPKHAA